MNRRRGIVTLNFRWRSLDVRIEKHIQQVLDSWLGTPYMDGQSAKGVGCDCVHFAAACIDELFGRPVKELPRLPNDACMHNRDAAMRVMRILCTMYQPMSEVTDGTLEPGDVLVVGPTNGGPGHVIFVGARRNTLYQALLTGVQQCGLSLPRNCKLFHVFRCTIKSAWI